MSERARSIASRGTRRRCAAWTRAHAHPEYRSTLLRAPSRPFLLLPRALADTSGPAFGHGTVGEYENDLTRQHDGEPLGERINVSGTVVDRDGRPIRNALIEIWQANSAGRYIHAVDRHPAPLDPNFTGAGRCMTDDEGRYRFVTIKPGAYPWGNHPNAWRPAHIHLSLFGRAFTDRLVTQMYFPGDPLFAYDPIFQSVRDPRRASGWSAASTSRRPSRSGRSGTASTSCSAARRRRRSRNREPRAHAIADRGAVLRVRALRARRERARRRRRGRRRAHRGLGARRRGRARSRRDGRDLAPVGALRHRRRRRLLVRHAEAGTRCRGRRRTSPCWSSRGGC